VLVHAECFSCRDAAIIPEILRKEKLAQCRSPPLAITPAASA
jgi:hypothetical protein